MDTFALIAVGISHIILAWMYRRLENRYARARTLNLRLLRRIEQQNSEIRRLRRIEQRLSNFR